MPPRRRAGPPPQHRLRGCNPSRECTSYEGAAAVAGLGDKLRVDETRSPAPAVHIDEPRPPPTALHLRERRVYTAHQLRGCRRATGRRRHGTGVPRHNQPGYVYKAFSSSVVVAQTNPFQCINHNYQYLRRQSLSTHRPIVSLGRTDYAANAGCLNQTAVRLESEKMEAMMPPCTKYEGAHDDIIW
eukprot:CAMPEP_0178700836 /NCGR_PEP_ID=MMETSP0699-20121125/11905_1 /TAXON_ID=265572 /ORGANISM="Extubocellulus spinifer, Strain CCMP396" /LENGTH=185 /DNA_ID=CAMNT_0020347235 /DNA_START=275 /DNA_END=829 /DNA_ORIENTATION=+